jgi:geranylgeranyl diphosphate synthase type II
MNSSQLLSIDHLLKIYVEKSQKVSFNETSSVTNEPVYYFISNDGKSIRPLLLLAACNMFDGDVDEALNPAFGVQMFHNFTLVHDDIMDESNIRRGEPTVHKKYGVNSAIITGDIMMIYAYDYLSKVDTSILHDVLTNFNLTAIRIIEGQQMDIDFESRMDVTEEEYIKMIGFKTSVLLAESLRIGSIIAKTSDENKELIYNFGLNLGLAFQIKDDWLDAFGSGEKFGKKIGGDIVQNKKTMLFVKAWELADEKVKEKITALMSHENEEEKIQSMLAIYNQLGVDRLIEDLMAEYFQKGLDYLEKIDIEKERKQSLIDFAHKIYFRDF